MLQKCSILQVAKVFFDEPTKWHYLMEISRKSKAAHTSVALYIKQLKKESIIIESAEKKGKRIFPIYKANLESIGYKKNKKLCNMLKLEDSGLIKHLKDKFMPKCIVAFGSYTRGEDTEDSDIDLFLECSKKEFDLTKFEKTLCRKIELQFKEDFKEYPNELKNNIINGVLLSGYLKGY